MPDSRRKFQKPDKRSIICGILSFCFLAVAVCAAVILFRGLYADHKAQNVYASLTELMPDIENMDGQISDTDPDAAETSEMAETSAEEADETLSVSETQPESSSAPAERTMISGFETLVQKNQDICGWIYIANTRISYPVMYTPDDPEYYLRRNFYGESSRSGTPFLGAGCTVDSDCLLIYGHNMNNGTMFSSLTSYKDKSFWQSNPSVWFNTLYEYRQYQVFAAVTCRLSENEAEGFQYYDASGDMTQEQFTQLMNWIKKHAAYDTGLEPDYGDQILIVSTCTNRDQDGRFFIAAYRKT